MYKFSVGLFEIIGQCHGFELKVLNFWISLAVVDLSELLVVMVVISTRLLVLKVLRRMF